MKLKWKKRKKKKFRNLCNICNKDLDVTPVHRKRIRKVNENINYDNISNDTLTFKKIDKNNIIHSLNTIDVKDLSNRDDMLRKGIIDIDNLCIDDCILQESFYEKRKNRKDSKIKSSDDLSYNSNSDYINSYNKNSFNKNQGSYFSDSEYKTPNTKKSNEYELHLKIFNEQNLDTDYFNFNTISMKKSIRFYIEFIALSLLSPKFQYNRNYYKISEGAKQIEKDLKEKYSSLHKKLVKKESLQECCNDSNSIIYRRKKAKKKAKKNKNEDEDDDYFVSNDNEVEEYGRNNKLDKKKKKKKKNLKKLCIYISDSELSQPPNQIVTNLDKNKSNDKFLKKNKKKKYVLSDSSYISDDVTLNEKKNNSKEEVDLTLASTSKKEQIDILDIDEKEYKSSCKSNDIHKSHNYDKLDDFDKNSKTINVNEDKGEEYAEKEEFDPEDQYEEDEYDEEDDLYEEEVYYNEDDDLSEEEDYYNEEEDDYIEEDDDYNEEEDDYNEEDDDYYDDTGEYMEDFVVEDDIFYDEDNIKKRFRNKKKSNHPLKSDENVKVKLIEKINDGFMNNLIKGEMLKVYEFIRNEEKLSNYEFLKMICKINKKKSQNYYEQCIQKIENKILSKRDQFESHPFQNNFKNILKNYANILIFYLEHNKMYCCCCNRKLSYACPVFFIKPFYNSTDLWNNNFYNFMKVNNFEWLGYIYFSGTSRSSLEILSDYKLDENKMKKIKESNKLFIKNQNEKRKKTLLRSNSSNVSTCTIMNSEEYIFNHLKEFEEMNGYRYIGSIDDKRLKKRKRSFKYNYDFHLKGGEIYNESSLNLVMKDICDKFCYSSENYIEKDILVLQLGSYCVSTVYYWHVFHHYKFFFVKYIYMKLFDVYSKNKDIFKEPLILAYILSKKLHKQLYRDFKILMNIDISQIQNKLNECDLFIK